MTPNNLIHVAILLDGQEVFGWRKKLKDTLSHCPFLKIETFFDLPFESKGFPVVLNLTSREVSLSREEVPWGVWHFSYPTPPHAFLERMTAGTFPVRLLAQWAPRESFLLWEGHFKLYAHSYRQSVDKALPLCHNILIPLLQILGKMKKDPFPFLTSCPLPPTHHFPDLVLNPMQRFMQRVKQWRITAKALAQLEFYQEHWNIGVIVGPLARLLENPDSWGRDIQWRKEEEGQKSFVADPFLLVQENRVHLLVEELQYEENRGFISSLIFSDSEAPFTTPLPLMKQNHHMSYPFLFRHQEDVYCLPETSENREVILYRAKNFPLEWEKAGVLLQGVPVVDATLFYHQDLWWLFATRADDGPLEKLYLWMSKDLTGPWTEHPLNPVKVDIRSARPAGSLFVFQGKLIRPSQDCSQTYGGALVLNEITELGPGTFSEKFWKQISPSSTGPYPDGLHTFHNDGNYSVVDGKRYFFSPKKTLSWLKRILSPSNS